LVVDSPGFALAFAAGFVSFVSPCCLPLVPGYLAAVSREAPSGGSPPVDRQLVARSLLFIGSFSAVFILLGLSATAIGSLLLENHLVLRKVAGIAIIVMGILFVGSVFLLRLNREWRPSRLIERAGSGGPVVAGLAFAIAWTPCIGPTLGAILGLASTQESAPEAAGLLAVYSAGLGVPFFLSAVGFSAAQRSFDRVKRHYAAIQVLSGLILIVMGILVYRGELFRLSIEAQQFLDRFGLNFFQSV
jgi:cytochrome c-type biogenesis protein